MPLQALYWSSSCRLVRVIVGANVGRLAYSGSWNPRITARAFGLVPPSSVCLYVKIHLMRRACSLSGTSPGGRASKAFAPKNLRTSTDFAPLKLSRSEAVMRFSLTSIVLRFRDLMKNCVGSRRNCSILFLELGRSTSISTAWLMSNLCVLAFWPLRWMNLCVPCFFLRKVHGLLRY